MASAKPLDDDAASTASHPSINIDPLFVGHDPYHARDHTSLESNSMSQPISDRIDRFVDWLKWPVAIAALVLLVPSVLASFELVVKCGRNPETILPFIGGAGLYLLVWVWTIRRWRTTLLSTFEHEFTHALFAILTLHRVTELKATWRSGGHVRIIGLGNWLITVAPYFFPTVCFLLIPIFRLLTFIPTNFADGIVGAAFVYHITSTMRETHGGQTDLKQVGYLFSTMFLPTAILVSHGIVLAFARSGIKGIHIFWSTIAKHLQSLAILVGLS
ncbi:MAG: M50 family metallopeptidase [Planctomycetales bacterium]